MSGVRAANPARRRPAAMCEFPVIIEQDEDGFFVAHCPDLRGCWSQGRTLEEALPTSARRGRGGSEPGSLTGRAGWKPAPRG
jgi:hypothetical protein